QALVIRMCLRGAIDRCVARDGKDAGLLAAPVEAVERVGRGVARDGGCAGVGGCSLLRRRGCSYSRIAAATARGQGDRKRRSAPRGEGPVLHAAPDKRAPKP